MPLIDLQMMLSFINERSLEQAGIIANFFAGLFLAIEYFVSEEKIDKLNDRLGYRTSRMLSRSSKAAKTIFKLNRKVLIAILAAVILLSIFEETLYHQSTLVEYFLHYFGMAKLILQPIHKALAAVLAVAIITYVLAFVARRAPKRTVGALGLLLFIAGNILLFLHTLYI
jgi:hypothetical protein